jgi:hypothetical protein
LAQVAHVLFSGFLALFIRGQHGHAAFIAMEILVVEFAEEPLIAARDQIDAYSIYYESLLSVPELRTLSNFGQA